MSFDPNRLAGMMMGLMLVTVGCQPSAPDSFEELASRSLAQLNGELDIPGLKEPVEVLRDEWGIPAARDADG